MEALSAGKWSGGPIYLILSDAKDVAVIEFGLKGIYRSESTYSGSVYHTNHYLNPDLQSLNPYQSGSSYKRADHIKNWLSTQKPFTVQDFIEESKNPIIWYTGATPQAPSTLSTLIVSHSPNGDARLYLRLANPGQPMKEYDLLVKDLFDGKVDFAQIK